MPLRLASIAVLAAMAATPAAHATTHSFSFSGTLGSLDPAASGFPAALAGVPNGSPYTAVLSFEATSTPATNTFSGIFAQATLYRPASFTFALTVGGQTLTDWAPGIGLHVFVWNDEPITGAAPNDGVLFMNVGAIGSKMFQFGNLLYSTSTLASDAMPAATISGPFALEAGLSPLTARWFDGGGQNLVFGSPVPEPSSWALMLTGALGLAAAGRLRRAAPR